MWPLWGGGWMDDLLLLWPIDKGEKRVGCLCRYLAMIDKQRNGSRARPGHTLTGRTGKRKALALEGDAAVRTLHARLGGGHRKPGAGKAGLLAKELEIDGQPLGGVAAHFIDYQIDAGL